MSRLLALLFAPERQFLAEIGRGWARLRGRRRDPLGPRIFACSKYTRAKLSAAVTRRQWAGGPDALRLPGAAAARLLNPSHRRVFGLGPLLSTKQLFGPASDPALRAVGASQPRDAAPAQQGLGPPRAPHSYADATRRAG